MSGGSRSVRGRREPLYIVCTRTLGPARQCGFRPAVVYVGNPLFSLESAAVGVALRGGSTPSLVDCCRA